MWFERYQRIYKELMGVKKTTKRKETKKKQQKKRIDGVGSWAAPWWGDLAKSIQI
jgi:hypothetical protein